MLHRKIVRSRPCWWASGYAGDMPPRKRIIWRVCKGTETAEASIRAVPELRLELRFSRNREVVATEVHQDPAVLINIAEDKHSELLGRGWIPATSVAERK